MSVRMRHTRAHTKNRRSHHALETPRLSTCKCGEKHVRHKVCMSCGEYRGRKVVDVKAIKERKTARYKAKMKSLGKDPSAKDDKNKPEVKEEIGKNLNPASLSKKAFESRKK